MGNIVLLDDLTINKIAAGEVIERPASVIKEMVENSIDAGATNIVVEIKNGGISFIKVTDNGKGIAKDDLEIAFERHATSKIRSADDLDTVTSMGFRGEALASIAAIANIELISKTQEQQIGYRVLVEAGEVLEKEETGCQTGTSITVRNLFFNTPVRYKFLKKDYTEAGYIEDVITRVALVHPEIAIKLINTGKTVIQTNGSGELKNVIYSIYGKNIAEGILPLSYQYEEIKIEGVIGKPEIARSNRSNQLFFVNQRYIKDKTLSAATEQAFKGMIPLGKFGFVILNLEINPAKVDVNVHPAKLEVRFEEESKVFQAVYHGIKDTLLKRDMENGNPVEVINEEKEPTNALFSLRKLDEKKIEQYTKQESQMKTPAAVREEIKAQMGKPMNTSDVLEKLRAMQQELQKQASEDSSIHLNPQFLSMSQQIAQAQKKEEEKITQPEEKEIKQQIEEKQEEFVDQEIVLEQKTQDQKQPIQEKLSKKEQEETQEILPEKEKKEETIQKPKTETYPITQNFDEMYQKLFGKPPATTLEKQQEEELIETPVKAVDLIKDNVSVFEETQEYKKPSYRFIGIAFRTYIILEMNQELYIMDQHAAHERIMYEKVKQNYYRDTAKDSQMLLLPDIITLTHKEMQIAKENIPMFKKAGFCLEEFGENTIKLTGVPTICIDLDTKELFLETLDEINTVARTAKQEKEEKFIATVACKAAVKANMALTDQEVQNLMDQLLALPNPFTCPHGRPTVIQMTKYDIERKFARK